jgi:hypothetical protein
MSEQMQKTLVKNTANTPPPTGDRNVARHSKAPASAAVPAGCETAKEALALLAAMPTEELHERAAQLAIPGADRMRRSDLLAAVGKIAEDVMDE